MLPNAKLARLLATSDLARQVDRAISKAIAMGSPATDMRIASTYMNSADLVAVKKYLRGLGYQMSLKRPADKEKEKETFVLHVWWGHCEGILGNRKWLVDEDYK